MKKFPLILSALLLSASFLSCGGETQKPVDSESVPDTKETENTDETGELSFIEKLVQDRSKISDDLPETDLNKKKISIAYVSSFSGDWDPKAENTDILLSDAVGTRNLAVMERFNVEFNLRPIGNDYETLITNEILSDSDDLDIIAIHPSYTTKMVGAGLFRSLNEFDDYLDFSKPWWIREANDSIEYRGNLYCAYGYATQDRIIGGANVIYFNKKIAEEYDLDNLYDVVRDGDWTLDYFENLIKVTAKDLNNDGQYTPADDQLSFFIPKESFLYCFLGYFNYHIVEKDESGVPFLNFDSPRLADMMERVKSMLEIPGVFCEGNYAQRFQEGRSLFGVSNVSNMSKAAYRNAGFEFGVLPPFKYDENQDHYYTYISGTPQGIPVSCKAPEEAALIMEAINAESYKKTVPVYYETMLKDKCSNDVDSAEMLDLTLEHVSFEPGNLFDMKVIHLLGEYCFSDKGYGSFLEESRSKNESILKDMIKTLDDLK